MPTTTPAPSPATRAPARPSIVTAPPPWTVLARLDFEPDGVALDGENNVYLADFTNHAVQKFSPAGRPLARWGARGAGPGQFSFPSGVAVDRAGAIYVADTFNARIQKLSPAGEPLAQWGSAGREPGQFTLPRGVAVDGDGNIYVADSGNERVQKLSPAGAPLAQWEAFGQEEDGNFFPQSVALDEAGNLYVTVTGLGGVAKLGPNGAFLARLGGPAAADRPEPGRFLNPRSVALDRAGNLYVTDSAAHDVQQLSPDGAPLARWVAQRGEPGRGREIIAGPLGIAVDGAGNLYVTETLDNTLLKLPATARR